MGLGKCHRVVKSVNAVYASLYWSSKYRVVVLHLSVIRETVKIYSMPKFNPPIFRTPLGPLRQWNISVHVHSFCTSSPHGMIVVEFYFIFKFFLILANFLLVVPQSVGFPRFLWQ